MAQRPKEHVREAILAATVAALAEAGLGGATVATIAARARTSIGNVYRYFPDKRTLFTAAVPETIVAELLQLLRRRVHALGTTRDVRRLGPREPYRLAAQDLARFAWQRRLQVLFLLRRAEGTPYAAFAEDAARELARLARGYARQAHPRARLTVARQRTLLRLYRAFLGAIAAVLAQESNEAAFYDAARQHALYHLAGLGALFASFEKRSARGNG